MRKAVIVSCARTPLGKAPRGTLRYSRPEHTGALVLNAVVERAGITKEEVDDIVLGCAFPEAEQGMNYARVISLYANFPDSVPAFTINRFCSSGLESIAIAASRIQAGWNDIIIAGGVEHMSRIPMGGNKISIDLDVANTHKDVYTPMGITAENVVARYGAEFNLTREELDKFAVASHAKAVNAQKMGYFTEQLVPVPYKAWAEDGKTYVDKIHTQDEGPRADTTLEGLAKLKPAFKQGGVVTAGNSSQMNDGAAAVLLMSEETARKKGLEILAYFENYHVAGCKADEMGVGPAYAIPPLLKKTGLTVADIDLWEINEAFASQALYSVRKIGIDPQFSDRVNVNGGAIALGHPLGCTGSKLTTQLMYEMKRRGVKRGVVSMCIGGGMGAAGLFRRP
jgi:acetyl-CoA acyltransferase